MKICENATETSAFYTWMGEDGICRTVVKKPGSEIQLQDARENSIVVNGFFTGKKFPILIDSRNIKSMARDAREHFSTKGRETSTNAFGILVKSPVSKVIGNFFMGINKPPVPTRLFDNEELAIEWLKKHVLL